MSFDETDVKQKRALPNYSDKKKVYLSTEREREETKHRMPMYLSTCRHVGLEQSCSHVRS